MKVRKDENHKHPGDGSSPAPSAAPAPAVRPPFTPDEHTLRVLPWLVSIAFLMQMLDGTIVATAIPIIAADLGESPLRMQAVIISYMLTTAVLIPASGWVADRFGTRRVFIAAIILFSLGSLFCALSPNLGALVASRVLQGAGGALLVPVGRLTILKSFPRFQMVRILSFITIPALLGPLGGPVLGGFLVQYASWPWIFFINLPLGLLGGILSLRYFPDLRDPRELGFDWWGFLLFGAAMICLSLALEGPGDMHMTARTALVLAGVGLGSLAVVIGAGGVGGYCVQIANASGAKVVAIDVDDARLQAIAGHGAALTLNSRQLDARGIKAAIVEFAKKNGLRSTEWFIFECSGTAPGQLTAFGLLVHGATLSVVGFTMDKIEIRLSNLMAFDARAIGNWGCPPEFYPAALDLVLDGKVQIKPFVEPHPLDDINRVFDAVHHREIRKRAVLVP